MNDPTVYQIMDSALQQICALREQKDTAELTQCGYRLTEAMMWYQLYRQLDGDRADKPE